MISYDFVQTGFLGSMINNAKCSWYFSHLILAPCPGLVKRLTKLISQPATLKLKENIQKNHMFFKSFKLISFTRIQWFYPFTRLTSFQISSGIFSIENNRFQQSKTWSYMKLWRIKTFHGVSCTFGFKNLKQNTESKAGRSGEKSAPFYACHVWPDADTIWYDLLRSDAMWLTESSELSTLLLCLCRLRSLWPHCFVDSSWREKEVLEVWRNACLGSFLKVIRWFCVVLFDYVLWSTILQHLFWCLVMSIHKKQSLVRGFDSETTELKSEELLRHSFLGKKRKNMQNPQLLWLSRGRRCRGIVWSSVFFWHRGLHCFLLKLDLNRLSWSEMWKKDTRERNSTMSQSCWFLLHRGDNYGRWQGRQGTEVFLKPFDPIPCAVHLKRLLRVLCSFAARPCRQMEAMEREAGCRVMAGCGFSSVVDPFQDFVTGFLENDMTEVAGSMKERTVTKAGQFYDDHIWSHMITTAWTWRHYANADDADDATGSSRGRWPKEKRNGLMARLNVEMSRKGWYLVLEVLDTCGLGVL